ncbi:hypothetical protein [Methylorubrum extorquens]|uniref:hypothetical protein n=1 Tax=Methylorubrum extorquens TaxID=408 RepID=UPI0005A51FB6|nr:hypothetical protein [Methylorubrum extorquens]
MGFWILCLGAFGVLVLLTGWLPMMLRQLPLSWLMCCVAESRSDVPILQLEVPQGGDLGQ